MLTVFGTTQRELLKEMFKSKCGLTVDDLTQRLGITRTAVNQHLIILERDGFVQKGESSQTGGRPGRNFLLSPKGLDIFPKQYSWFSGIMLTAIKNKTGSAGLSAFMKETARLVADSLALRIANKARPARLAELVLVMNELAYEATVKEVDAHTAFVEATNCVYHGLAKEHPEVCDFDLEILGLVTDSKVTQHECIVRGGGVCRFELSDCGKRSL